jgi:uncharacterized membrane protein
MDYNRAIKARRWIAYTVGIALILFGVFGIITEANKGSAATTIFSRYVLGSLIIICGICTCVGTRLRYGGGLWSFVGLICVAFAIARCAFVLDAATRNRHIISPIMFYGSSTFVIPPQDYFWVSDAFV